MTVARSTKTFPMIAALMAIGFAGQVLADEPAPESPIPWEKIQSGQYVVKSVVAEREGESLSRILNARLGEKVEISVDDDKIVLQIEGREKAIELPRSTREDAGTWKHPYTHFGRTNQLTSVEQKGPDQILTFWVPYRGHFILEGGGEASEGSADGEAE